MFVHLDNRALLKITGKDSESFLQSQLSNDVNKLDNSSIQLSAYCQHQGKILTLFLVAALRRRILPFFSFGFN